MDDLMMLPTVAGVNFLISCPVPMISCWGIGLCPITT